MNEKEFFEEKICEYRNCNNVIEGRSDKRYCCRMHKMYEKTYRKRKEKLLKDALLNESKRVEAYKELKEIIKKG